MSDCKHFVPPLQGPTGYKGIQGPAGIPGPPVRKHKDSFSPTCNQVPIVRYSKPFPVDHRGRRGLRDHLERQEILETKYGTFLSVSFFFFLTNRYCEIGILLFVAEYYENICLLQGSRGIRGPQGAVGKKGDNVSKKGKEN